MSLAEMFGNNTEDRFKNGPLLLTIEDAYRRLGLSRTRFFRELRDGRIRYIRVGSKRLIPAAALQEYIDERGAEQLTALDSDRGVASIITRETSDSSTGRNDHGVVWDGSAGCWRNRG
jgi:excisionase family DNA binding protein